MRSAPARHHGRCRVVSNLTLYVSAAAAAITTERHRQHSTSFVDERQHYKFCRPSICTFCEYPFRVKRLKMRYVAAYLLASLSGKEPSGDDVEKILSSVGIESDAQKLGIVLKELKGKNVDELIESGKAKLASVPSGAAVAAPAGAAAPAASEEKAAKKEEKKEESDNESDDDMGFGLFN